MSEQVEEKAVELMDKAANDIEVFAGKLDALGKEYGPEVVDLALAAARVDALSKLLLVLGAGVVLFIAVRSALFLAPKSDWDDIDPYSLGTMIASLVGLVSGIGFILLLFKHGLSPWPWVGLFEPKLWIAKQVLGL